MDSQSSASGCERLFLTPSDHTNLKHAKSIKKRFSLCQEITSYLQAALNEYYDQNPVTPRRYSTILPESFIVTLIHLEILKPSIWNTIVDLTNICYKKTTGADCILLPIRCMYINHYISWWKRTNMASLLLKHGNNMAQQQEQAVHQITTKYQ